MADSNPVSVALSKRLRAVKKKLNKADQIEQAVAAGKAINEDQKEVLKSKAGCIAVIDELSKLDSILKEAVAEELEIAKKKWEEEAAAIQPEPAVQEPPVPVPPAPAPNLMESSELQGDDGEAYAKAVQSAIEQIIPVIYFSRMFETSSKDLLSPNPALRDNCMKHLIQQESIRDKERYACRTWISQTGTEELKDQEMQLIVEFGNLITVRPQGQIISHEMAIEHCCRLATKLVLEAAEPMHEVTGPDGMHPTGDFIADQIRKIKESNYYRVHPVVNSVGTGVEQQGSQMTLENFQAMQGLPRPPSLPDMTANLLGQMASSTNPQVSAHSQPATTSSEASSSSPPQVNGGLPATTAATSYEHWHYGAMGMQPGSSTVPYPGIADPKQMASMPLGQAGQTRSPEGMIPSQQIAFGTGMSMTFPSNYMIAQHSGMHHMMPPGAFGDQMFGGMHYMPPPAAGKVDMPPATPPNSDPKTNAAAGPAGKDSVSDGSNHGNSHTNRQRAPGGDRGGGGGRYRGRGDRGGGNRGRNYENSQGGRSRGYEARGSGPPRNRQNQPPHQQPMQPRPPSNGPPIV